MKNHQTETAENLIITAKDLTKEIEDAVLYENSIHEDAGDIFFLIRKGIIKKLIVISGSEETEFTGESISADEFSAVMCDLTHRNADAIRERFSFTMPILLGNTNSYGFGDRLGNAGPAHLRSVRNSGFRPVLAQQSIRELERTKRTASEVMDAATWSVFQEGYHEGFGADGDHLKTTGDIDRMVEAGYTMFTIDPSEYVQDDVKSLNKISLESAYKNLPWDLLEDTSDSLLERFTEEPVEILDDYHLNPTPEEVMQGMVKYGRVVTHTRNLADYLSKRWPDHPAELELSVDETQDPTTLFEHYLVASELNRLGVELVSLAPRFCGHFEKGIDFKGDLDQFRSEYI
ncbi:MAG: tagaturonate epimerase family protein, partial [Balneolaceae bacterium]